MFCNEPLTLVSDESSYNVTAFASRRLPMLLDIVFTFLAYRRCVAFAVLPLPIFVLFDLNCFVSSFIFRRFLCVHIQDTSNDARKRSNQGNREIILGFWLLFLFWLGRPSNEIRANCFVLVDGSSLFLPRLLKFRSTICAFDDWIISATFLWKT